MIRSQFPQLNLYRAQEEMRVSQEKSCNNKYVRKHDCCSQYNLLVAEEIRNLRFTKPRRKEAQDAPQAQN